MTSARARLGSLRSLCSCGEEAWVLGSGSILGAWNLHGQMHGQMVSEKTLAAESSSCGDQRWPHSPDVGLPYTPPTVPDLKRTSQSIAARHNSIGRGLEGPPSASHRKLVGSVLGFQGCLDGRGHSWAESVTGKVGPQPPWSIISGFLPTNVN